MSTTHQEGTPIPPEGNNPLVSQETLFDLGSLPTVSHSGQLPVEEGGERPEVREFDNTTLSEAAAKGYIGTTPESPAALTPEPATKTGSLTTRGRRIAAGVTLVGLGLAGGVGYAVHKGGDSAPSHEPSATSPDHTVAPSTTPNTPPPSPTDIPTATGETNATATPSPEKGSVESYEVSVKDYPTPALAIPALGEQLNEFINDGYCTEDYVCEAPKSIHADDNILAAVYGPFEDNHTQAIANLRGMREKVATAKAGQKASGSKDEIYVNFWYEVVDKKIPKGGGRIAIVEHHDTNIGLLFPNNTAWDVTEYHYDVQLTKIKSEASGNLVWVLER